MKKTIQISLLIVLAVITIPCFAEETVTLTFSTFFGGQADEAIRDVEVDGDGNCYSSTCDMSNIFPTTPWTVQTAHAGGVDWGIVKLSPTGELLAATLTMPAGPERWITTAI